LFPACLHTLFSRGCSKTLSLSTSSQRFKWIFQLYFSSLPNMIRFSFFVFVTRLPNQIILFRVKDESISFSQWISIKNLMYMEEYKSQVEELSLKYKSGINVSSERKLCSSVWITSLDIQLLQIKANIIPPFIYRNA
jgi:hypothetical protein